MAGVSPPKTKTFLEFYLKQVYDHDHPESGKKVKMERDIMTCELERRVCGAATATGKKCTRSTVMMLPYCWQHTKKLCGVYAADSCNPEAGRGLFAAVDFGENQLIGRYDGRRMTKEELDELYPGDITAPYAAEHLHEDVVIDAACSRHIASLINHTDDESKINCKLFSDESDGNVYARTTRAVEPNEEFLTTYGDEYQFDETTPSGTRRVRRKDGKARASNPRPHRAKKPRKHRTVCKNGVRKV